MNLDIRDTLVEVKQEIGAALAGLDYIDQAENELGDDEVELFTEAKEAVDNAMLALTKLLGDAEEAA